MNGEYIRMEGKERLLELASPIIGEKPREWQEKVIELYRERIQTISGLKSQADFLLNEEIEINKEAEETILKKDGILNNLKATEDALKNLEPFTKETIEETLRTLAKNLNVKTKDIFHPLRVCVTGRSVSPPLFDVLELLAQLTQLPL